MPYWLHISFVFMSVNRKGCLYVFLQQTNKFLFVDKAI